MINLVIDFSSDTEKVRLYKVLQKLKPTRYQLELKKFRENRSMPQNKYYWGVVISELSKHTGFTSDEMHELLKFKFLPNHKILPNGEEVRLAGSTSKLTTDKMEEYLEQIRIFAISELDCYIPLPNEL